jgi:hypothetical protein
MLSGDGRRGGSPGRRAHGQLTELDPFQDAFRQRTSVLAQLTGFGTHFFARRACWQGLANPISYGLDKAMFSATSHGELGGG